MKEMLQYISADGRVRVEKLSLSTAPDSVSVSQKDDSLYKKWWFWTAAVVAVGGGAAIVWVERVPKAKLGGKGWEMRTVIEDSGTNFSARWRLDPRLAVLLGMVLLRRTRPL